METRKLVTKRKLERWRKQLSPDVQGRDRTREIVRIRDNYTCQQCGLLWEEGQRRLDVHHLDGLCGKMSLGYDKVSDIDGLLTLCHRCHYKHPEYSHSPERLLKSIDFSVFDL